MCACAFSCLFKFIKCDVYGHEVVQMHLPWSGTNALVYDEFFVSFFSEKGKYYIDFKNGEGAVGQGDPEHKPDVTITMNEDVFLKIFNRK